MADTESGRFTPEHHALLFAWMAQELVTSLGEARAATVLRKAVWRYGRQRGHRMALRALGNGDPLTLLTFMAYGEWRAPEGAMEATTVQTTPDLHRQVHRCPWFAVWQIQGVMDYGRHYCRHIDKAILHGFNPELRLKVRGTRPDGSACCEFYYPGADLDKAAMSMLQAKQAALGLSVVMPWEYHVGHLYKSLSDVMTEALGPRGRAMASSTLALFGRHFGEAAARAVAASAETDFSRLPDTSGQDSQRTRGSDDPGAE